MVRRLLVQRFFAPSKRRLTPSIALFVATLSATYLSPLCQAQPAITSVAGYYTPNDSFQHAIVTTDDGRLHETYFDPKRNIFHDELGCYGHIVQESSFYSNDDQIQHALVMGLAASIRPRSASSCLTISVRFVMRGILARV